MRTHELTLDIDGMTCASCVRRVERALERVPGVQACSVNLATNQAVLMLAPAAASGTPPTEVSSLIAAVEKAGYQASVHEEQAPPKPADDHGGAVALAVALSLPLVLPMLLQPLGLHLVVPALWQWLLATPVQFVLGWRFYRAGWAALRAGSGNMDLLVALGTSAAYGLSLWLWLWAPAGHASGGTEGGVHAGGAAHLYFESSAVVITLVMLGKWLEARAKRRTLAALDALRALRPDTALVMVDGQPQERPLGVVKVGDTVMVRPGQRVGVDGEIIEGRSHLDESAITGESLPVAREAGQHVVGGTLNGEGLLLVRTTAVGAESALSRIVRLVEQAQARKAPIQQTVDRISAVFVPAVIGVALLTLLGWGLLAPHQGWEHAIVQAVSVLVIACPCALGLATPATLMVGTGMAARMGLLVRDAQALELLRGVTVLALDKTGTLTLGQPRLLACTPVGTGEDQALALAAALQQGSEHPLARAVREAAAERGLTLPPCTAVQAVAGRGIQGTLADGGMLYLGSPRWMLELGVDLQPVQAALDKGLSQGRTVSILARSGTESAPATGLKADRHQAPEAAQALAALSFGDTLRPEAREAIAALKALGIRCVMISGDNRQAAQTIAAEVGIDEVRAPVLPAEKAQAIRALHQGLAAGQRVAMVGDGVNDAPALAAADIGLAMPGTDVAMETAGLTLLRPDLRLIPRGIALSRAVTGKIHQNLFWAFAYNVVGIPMAAFGLLSPVVAGAAMAASSISVITNALMLRRWRG